jgi:hypothetical protein
LLLFFKVATGIADVISAHCYCDLVTFMMKKKIKLHSGFILDVLHVYKKLMR